MIRKKIKEAIELKGHPQRELAEAIGIRRATLSDYLNGKSEMTSGNLEKMFQHLGIELILN